MTIQFKCVHWEVFDEELGVAVAIADTEREAKYLARQIERK